MYHWSLLLFLPMSLGLIAYDCGSSSTEITTISLRDVEECPPPDLAYTSSPVSVKVLQRKSFTMQRVWTCQIVVTRMISYCGMYSHSSVVSGGLKDLVYRVGGDECKLIHRDGTVRLYGNTIGGIRPNSTTTASVTALGQLDNAGKCVGATYQEDGVNWSNVVIIASVKITIKDFYATVKLEENTISVSRGISCAFLPSYCFDAEVGEAVWDVSRPETCGGHLSQLYYGSAEEVVHKQTGERYLVVESDEKIFALTYVKPVNICGITAWQTEHPRIIVVSGKHEVEVEKMATEDTDRLAYMNSKFLYVEQAYKREMAGVYIDTIHRRCLLQREILKNRLLMAPILPSVISLLIQEKEGYTGRVLGEVLYILKCTPTPVEIRRETRCYNEIPVTVHNQSKFMAPLTRIIQDVGEQIDCNGAVPPLFYLDGEWIGMIPHPTIKQSPQMLEPEEKGKLKFGPIQPIGAKGLYTQDEVAKVQNIMTFGVERTAITNIISRKISNLEAHHQGYSPLNLFDEEEIKRLASSTLSHMWGWFSTLGQAVSGLIGFYIIYRLIKYVVEVVINGLQLYQVVGRSFKLVACLWSTLALCIIQRHNQRTRKEDIEMGTIEADGLGETQRLTASVKSLPAPSTRQNIQLSAPPSKSMGQLDSESSTHWTDTLRRPL